MAKFDNKTVDRWAGMARTWLAANTPLSPMSILNSGDAWKVAHRCGITREAYADRTVTDAHIETALRKIFPHAWPRKVA